MEIISTSSQEAEADLLKRFLAERDVLCPRCEYNLRDLVGDRCPECGDRLVLRVNLSEPKLGPFLAGLVGLSAGAGLNGLLLIYAAFIFTRLSVRDSWFIISNIIGFVGEGVALLLWLKMWRRLRRRPTSTQRWWAIACWMLTAADLTLFILTIR